MLINIWHPKEEYINISPDTIVHTMRMTDNAIKDLLCDMCWTKKYEMNDHFWFSKKENKIEYLEMAFKEYVAKHKEEIIGMNPFFTLGRIKFLEKWNSKWSIV
jgi:hypothetical protein